MLGNGFCCMWLFLALFIACVDLGNANRLKHVSKGLQIYLNEFAVEIKGGNDHASAIAKKHGFINTGQVGTLEGWYIFIDRRIRKRSLEHHTGLRHKIRKLKRDVLAMEQLKIFHRVKRDPVMSFASKFPNDPSWDEMWYMHCGEVNSSTCPCSMRVTDAWRAGYHGKNVVVTILDDGIEKNHPDLRDNYEENASIDINDGDSDPTPRYDPSNENKHGTRCAGVVASELDNHICSVGIAYQARIGGVRMLDGDVTDKVESASLNFAHNFIDIYSASWGPDDDGTTVEGPGALAKAAFKNGAINGRHGKGSIFVWASGNGGHNKDSCACDGYINSIYTIGISSVSQYGYRPWYLEACASTLASTYSSGELNEGKVITTDLHSSCTHLHTGTSASAPMASGIIALMLQANMNLTWRDVQHIIVRTAKPTGLKATDWVVNGAGYNVSHVFGFGLLDAAAMTHVATLWKQVPEQKECITNPQRSNRPIIPSTDDSRHLVVNMDARACHGSEFEVAYLEHVILRISLTHPHRGDLNILLTSPSGTVSNILDRRVLDRSKLGFTEWDFMTTHHWGENPMGVWHLEIRDYPRHARCGDQHFCESNARRGTLEKWQLIFYGSSTHPQPNFHFENCDAFPQEHCHPECDGCCGASSFECRSCRHVVTLQGQCVGSCSDSQFVDEPTGVCKPCWSTCGTCDDAGPNNCTSCKRGYTLANGECVKLCSQGFYLEESTQTCRICDQVCKTCYERSTHCTSCRDAYIFTGNTCRPSCPYGTYFKSVAVGCRSCNISCVGCSHYSTRCISCADGYVMHRQRCTTDCSRRYYPDFRKQICRECHSTCKACTGPFPNQCTRCSANRVLHNGQCQTICQDAYQGHFLKNPCSLVLRYHWCQMAIFSTMCCQTCSQFGPNSVVNDDDYYYGAEYNEADNAI
ncbi:unnamed protein product [Clavelina lepadiformis]|uniref:P/Homo B domain-containing protein n=1 Tax=Clavelina lepadiformis TaxID=159417 RepID=A0ABP0FVS4_CLALP